MNFEEIKQDPLQIPNTMLKKTKLSNRDVIAQKHDFLQISGNEHIQVIPPVAKFTGFEINKLNILKLKVLNQAPIPQRIHVLSSKKENNVFQVKMIKKGLLASGMNEDIYIHFRPQEYRYYYDTIKINSETCNIQIPIHAYPVPNRQELRELFPKIIDFGTVDIGDSSLIRHQLKCKIPLNYEFEFVFIKPCSDIMITPSEGKIPGAGQIDIDLIYTPTNNATVVAEIELRLSQFDYEPLDIRLIGNGRYPNPNDIKRKTGKKLEPLTSKSGYSQQFQQTQKSQQGQLDDEQLNESIGEIDNQDKQYKTLMRPASRRQQLSQQSQNQNPEQNESKRSFKIRKNTQQNQLQSSLNQNQLLNNIDQNLSQNQSAMTKQNQTFQPLQSEYGRVDLQRQSQEKEYIDKFNNVRLLDKNKEIKFFQCIGDKQITEETQKEIIQEREDFENQQLEQIEEKGIHRYDLQLDSDNPIIEQVVPTFDCQWDFDKNDPMKRRFLIQKRLVTAGSKIILKNRKEERLQMLKNFLGGKNTKKEVKELVNLDHQKAEYAGIGKKDFTQFSFEFEEHNINKFLFPIQYDSSNTFSNFKFEVNPRTGFDDWSQIEPIEYCDAEVMDYRNQDLPQIVLYPPIETQRKNRQGAEEEYSYMGKLGQLEKVKEVEAISEPIPKSFLRPFDIETHRLLLPHPTVRRYCNYDEITEVDPEYYLQHEPISTQDEFDPCPEDEDLAVLKYEYLRKTPGLNSIHALNTLQIEQVHHYNNRLELPKDCCYESELEKYCPGILPDKDYDDNITDDDSDGEGPPVIQVENVADFLNEIEDKDENIQNIKEKNKQEIFDESDHINKQINQNLANEKQRQISTIPSKSTDYNRYINDNTNKLYIL